MYETKNCSSDCCSAAGGIGRLRKGIAYARARGKQRDAASRQNSRARAGDAKTHRNPAANRDANADG